MAKPGLRVSCSLFECLFFYELFYKVFTALLFGFYILYNFYTAYILYFFYRLCIVYLWLSVVRFGHWVCGESWHAIKDSLTHRPSSQGWAPGVLPFYVQVFVSCVYLDGGMGGGG